MRTRFRFLAAAVIGLSGVVWSMPLAAQQINTGSSGTADGWFPFGAPNTATYGQTFTAPAGSSALDQFTLQLRAGSNGGAIDFYGYLMAWSGDRAAGPVLYQSSLQHGTNSATPVTYTFNTGGIGVSSGSIYVAFLNASDFIAANPFVSGYDFMPSGANSYGDSYSGGDFVFYNNGGDFGALTSSHWDYTGAGGFGTDVAFTATFDATATPEPASLILLGTGLFGLVPMIRRKRN